MPLIYVSMSVHQSVLYCIDPLKLLKYYLIPPDVQLAGAGIGSVTFYISLKLLLILSHSSNFLKCLLYSISTPASILILLSVALHALRSCQCKYLKAVHKNEARSTGQ